MLTKDTLGAFLDNKESAHKVKFVVFSPRASPPSPLLRRAATEYTQDVAFARVHFERKDAAYWIRTFGVHTPPAVLVLKEGGANVVEHEVSGKDRLKAGAYTRSR